MYCRVKKLNIDSSPNNQKNLDQQFENLFNASFTSYELSLALDHIPKAKSLVQSTLPEFLTYLSVKEAAILSLIDLTWSYGIPDLWKKAENIPILKKTNLR